MIGSRESVLAVYAKFHKEHGKTQQRVRHLSRRKLDPDILDAIVLEAISISSAVQKYVGSAAQANEILGIKVKRLVKWPKEKLLAAVKAIIDAIARYPGGIAAIYAELGIERPKRLGK